MTALVWYLVIFGPGFDASAGHIPQRSREECIAQADWINRGQTPDGFFIGHAYCVYGVKQ